MGKMIDAFREYLSKQASMSDEIIEIAAKNAVIQQYKKGTTVLREGDSANTSYLILKGCMRSYIIKDGEEKTIEFFTEEQSFQPPNFGKNTLSDLYLECIEDTAAVISTPELETDMIGKFPELASVCHAVTEEKMSANHVTFMDYKITSAEERYLKLIKQRPDLIQRVPQYQLASYLGIQPQSLSRIRKRISQKKQ